MGPYLERAVAAGVTPPDRLEFIIEELPKILDAMLTGTERIKKIVENTATFTRLAENDSVKSVDLNECVQDALDGLRGALGMVGLDLRLAPDLPPVRGTQDAVVEIVTELIRNGVRAVATRVGPMIAISTAMDPSGEALLTVEDNGAGIREEDRAKVFTPFFTTEMRIGTPGLGLSKVYALARSLGGDVYFTTRHGHGSRFNVKLPFSTAGERNETTHS
jgi:polar amino acid transport system substrate-binding protein